jgi:hypothetical protein
MDPPRSRTKQPRATRRSAGKTSAAAIALAALTLAACGGAEADDETIRLAKDAYDEVKAQGVDMTRGPCLGMIKPGWVADVAHDPREDIDDRPENQCEAYRKGEADHFVELDPEGNFIRSG